MPAKLTPKTETKNIRHDFTDTERQTMGGDLARCIARMRGVETEFDQVKASYKAKTAEIEAQTDNISTNLMNGFEMRNEKCVVVYDTEAREKDYFLDVGFSEQSPGAVVLTEPMTADDFALELIQAESLFDNREEIDLFAPTDSDNGKLIVGRFAGKWFSALRVKIGKLKLEERLDSEQRSFKARPDAVTHAIKRVKDWSKENLKDHAKGFEESFKAVAEAHKERAE